MKFLVTTPLGAVATVGAVLLLTTAGAGTALVPTAADAPAVAADDPWTVAPQADDPWT